MKKIYYLSLICLISLNTAVFGQDVIVGGDMEDEESWLVSLLNSDDDNTIEYQFAYTDETPWFGSDGCLYIAGTNTGAAGGQLTNIMFYQQLTLERGTIYRFDGAYKDVRTNNFWIEVYVGGNEPEVGSDYGADQGAVLVSGFKSMNWESTCPFDEFDGTFQQDACISGISNEVFFDGVGDTTVYFGFRMGIWDDGGNGYIFEVYVDDISLISGNANSIEENQLEMNLYPNPFEDKLTISLDSEIEEIEVLNVLGQSVHKAQMINSSIYQLNMAGSASGIYYVIVRDINGTQASMKTIKY